MPLLPRLFSFRRNLFRKRQVENELHEEVQNYLNLLIEENLKKGLGPEASRRAALIELGGVEQVKESVREVRMGHQVEIAWQDLRYAARMILNRPGFSIVVVLVLALGIGATSAICSVVNAVLLRPLPYPEPQRLMRVLTIVNKDGRSNGISTAFGPDFVEWRKQCRTCEQMAAYTGTFHSNLTGGTEPDRVQVATVTDNLFATLGVQPMLGRSFLPGETGRPLFSNEGQSVGSTAVILSYELWQKRFDADPEIIGRTARVEGDVCTIVGVMPDGFRFPDRAEAWMPATISPKRDNAFIQVIARLQPGETQAQAQAELTAIAGRLEQEFPGTNRGLGLNLVPLHEYIVGKVRPSLLVFLGAVGFVLLIACANVANLLLSRATTRKKEIAVRSALGASRSRIIRQLLTESLLLALLGGGLGILLAYELLNLLVAFAPQEIPRLTTIRVDQWVLGFTLLISILAGLIFGLAPALQASKPDVNATLKEGGMRQGDGASHHRLRGLLVIAEVSLALVLLVGAGLLLKSFMRLRQTDLGLNPDRVLVASVTLSESSSPKTAQVKAFYRQALARLAVRPELQAVAIVNALPLGNGVHIKGDLTVEGESAPRPGVEVSKIAVSADYFRALSIPLREGRFFNERDSENSPGVLIISEALARQLWPNEDALGKRLNIGFSGETWREVVGIVGDVRQDEVGALSPAIYQPYLQVADSRRWMLGDMTFVMRTITQPESFAAGLRSELQAVDKELPLYDIEVMAQVIGQKVADPRFYTLLLGSFSALALLLAVAGIYGVISYSVSQRTHEIGIRMALGARRGDVLLLVIKQGMILVLTGLAIGIAGALTITRVLSDFLYQVSATDPVTFALLPLLLASVALLACYIPAHRATKVEPMVALRYE